MAYDVATIRQMCQKSGTSFVWNTDDERDEDKQTASFYFVGKQNGKEVVFDAFMMTLAFDYEIAVMEEAETKMIAKYPALNGVDYLDYTEAQQDEFDDLMDEVYEQGLVRVQERVDVFEGENEGDWEMEIALNIHEITETSIEKFVREYNAETLELDDEMRTFTPSLDE